MPLRRFVHRIPDPPLSPRARTLGYLVAALLTFFMYLGTKGVASSNSVLAYKVVPLSYALAMGLCLAAAVRRHSLSIWATSGIFVVLANVARAVTLAYYGTPAVKGSAVVFIVTGVYVSASLGAICAWLYPLRPPTEAERWGR